MKKNPLLLALYLLAMAPANATLDTLGQVSESTSLYACIVTSQKNPIPSNGQANIYHTACRKLDNQKLNTESNNPELYAPKATFGKIERAFFWHREADYAPGSEALINFCNTNLDYFNDCGWAEVEAIEQKSINDLSNAPDALRDILNQPTPSLTGEAYGCAVILCLANPNGWASVSECKPPVHKLFRDLWKGRGWPTCNK